MLWMESVKMVKDKIAKKHNLKVIYDAAHAFSTEINGKGIGTYGDITMFSFHATKLFNTIEGGCLTYASDELRDKIFRLRNFGIKSEEVVAEVGINGKLNEFQAAVGLLNLDIFREEQNRRKAVKEFYDSKLSKIEGITLPQMPDGTTNSYQYYPIVINEKYPLTRDALYDVFKSNNIMVRKYFYPACNDFECYKGSVRTGDLSVVNEMKHKVLCLPYYGNLDLDILNEICEVVSGK